MPITAFSNFTDGLDPNRRSREHFITNVNLEDEYLWVHGAVAAYEDGFTLLELTRKYYREAGLDVRQLDLLVR